jgi:DNA-binding NtrC family response regulator
MYVLVVEDTPDVRDLLCESLNDAGHDCKCTATVKAALEVLASGTIGVVVTDAALPDGSGLDVAAVAEKQDVRCVLISGDIEASFQTKVKNVTFLQKPFAFSQLLRAVGPAEESQSTKTTICCCVQ